MKRRIICLVMAAVMAFMVPQTTELLYLLKQNGYELPDGVIATGDCVSELLALLRRENCGNTEC